MARKYYRVTLINKETGERQMLINRYTSPSHALKGATSYCCYVGIKAEIEIRRV